ncbi:MAG: hypothetical protein V4463_16505 [Pseudomonadota bacterium]
MTTVSSISSLKIQIALAERQVARDQSQVQEDRNRLDQSQAQLDSDARDLNATQGKASQQSAAPAPAPTLDRAIQSQAATPALKSASATTPTLPAPPAAVIEEAPRAQRNTQGQTIGTLINIAV